MTTSMRAHFDGRMLIPDEPVDLPVGEALHLDVRPAAVHEPSIGERRAALERLKGRALLGPPIPDSALDTESIYEDE